MTPDKGAGWIVLDHGEDVALWRRLGLGDRPVLLDVPDHGDTLAARDAADRAALARLRSAGLLDASDRPEAPDRADASDRAHRSDRPHRSDPFDRRLADALGVLARPAVELDARLAAPDERSALLAAGDGTVTVVASRDEAQRLHLRLASTPSSGLVAGPVDPAGSMDAAGSVPSLVPAALGADDPAPPVVDALLDALPTHPGGPAGPVRLPAGAVLGLDAPTRRERLTTAKLPPGTRRQLADLFDRPPQRVLRLGAARRGRDGRRRRAPHVLTVVDAVAGRLLVRHRDDTVELRPLRPADLRRELLALLDEIPNAPRAEAGSGTAPIEP